MMSLHRGDQEDSLLLLGILGGPAPAQAQHLGLSLSAGTTGAGAALTAPLLSRLNLRAAGNFYQGSQLYTTGSGGTERVVVNYALPADVCD